MYRIYVILCFALVDVVFNSSPPGATYMRQWIGSTLVQTMACRLFGNKCWVIVKWNLRNKLQWNFNQNTKLQWNLYQNTKHFIQENASENIVCEIAAILSYTRRVNELVWFIYSYSFGVDSLASAPRITITIWCYRNPISQWQCSFHLKAALSLVKKLATVSDHSSEQPYDYQWGLSPERCRLNWPVQKKHKKEQNIANHQTGI